MSCGDDAIFIHEKRRHTMRQPVSSRRSRRRAPARYVRFLQKVTLKKDEISDRHAADAASYLGLSSTEVLHFPGCIESIKHRDRNSMLDLASRGRLLHRAKMGVTYDVRRVSKVIEDGPTEAHSSRR
jgi:hypothetical protein